MPVWSRPRWRRFAPVWSRPRWRLPPPLFAPDLFTLHLFKQVNVTASRNRFGCALDRVLEAGKVWCTHHRCRPDELQ